MTSNINNQHIIDHTLVEQLSKCSNLYTLPVFKTTNRGDPIGIL